MAVIALVSAKGSPGVTTSALALAFAWPRAVLLIEADPSGGTILPGFFRGDVDSRRAISETAYAHRYGNLADELPKYTLPLDEAGNVLALAGFTDPAQAAHMHNVWPALGDLANSLEYQHRDVIIDAGRVGSLNAPSPLIDYAEALLLVTRSDIKAAASTRPVAHSLQETRNRTGRSGTIGLLMIGEGRPYSINDFSQEIPTQTWTKLDWDPAAAAVYSDGTERPRGFDKSRLNRSATDAAQQIISRINKRRDQLNSRNPERASR
jgi:MinD-like ATPase involved in chromosome partitioning or flagellar assembly